MSQIVTFHLAPHCS